MSRRRLKVDRCSISFLTFVLGAVFCFCVGAAPGFAASERGTVSWQKNYEEAVNQARVSSKPLLLFFTGSDWCDWCLKFEEDTFSSNDFAKKAGDNFVYVKLDFPLYTPLDPQIGAQNRQLQKKFDVRSFPTVIILEPQLLQPIAMTGYRAGGGKSYADHLAKFVNEYTGYKGKMQALDTQTFSGQELKTLYEKAKELGFSTDAMRIVKKGLLSDAPLYFMTERYRFLAEEGQIHEEEAVTLRQQLLSLDSNNLAKTHYQIAVIDFEAYSGEMDKEHYSPDLAVAPLVAYVEKFGNQDKDNLWRLQMIISQVFLDKNRYEESLKFAKSSQLAAPTSVKGDIAIAIKNIQSQMK